MRLPSRFLVSSICALALVGSCGLAGATSSKASAAKISAHLTKMRFKSTQAGSVKLIYKFSAPSKSFSYLLTFKKGAKWQKVKNIKKTGSFKGSHTMTAKKVFGGKVVKVGSYRVKLSADGGSKLLSFRVVKAKSGGSSDDGSTGGDTTPTGSAPINSSLPTVAGTPEHYQTLTSSTGSWSNSPTSYSYLWLRCDSLGANCIDLFYDVTSSHAVTTGDVGHTIRVKVTASNDYGSASAASNQTAVVSGLPPVNISLPVITGTTMEGMTLTVSTDGDWSNSPTSYSAQWVRCFTFPDPDGRICENVPGTSSLYTLQNKDVGFDFYAIVTAYNSDGSASATSNEVGPVQYF